MNNIKEDVADQTMPLPAEAVPVVSPEDDER